MTIERIRAAHAPRLRGKRLRWRAGATLGAIAGMTAFAGVGTAQAEEACSPASQASCIELAPDTEQRFVDGTLPMAADAAETAVDGGDRGADSTSAAGSSDEEAAGGEPAEATETDGADSADDGDTADLDATDADIVDLGADTAADPAATVVVAPAASPAPAITSPAAGTHIHPKLGVSGTAVGGSTLTLSVDGVTVCTVVVPQDGSWRCSVSLSLPDGEHVFIASQTDDPSDPLALRSDSAPITLIVDTTPPAAPGDVICFADPTGAVSCSGTGEPDAHIWVNAGGTMVCAATVAIDGSWMCDSHGPTQPTAIVSTDHAGNVSPSVAVPALPGTTTCTADADENVTCGGTSAAGAAIEVLDDTGATVCTATATAGGTWSCTSTGPVTSTPLSALHVDRVAGVANGHYGIVVSPAPALTPAPDQEPAPAPIQDAAPAPTQEAAPAPAPASAAAPAAASTVEPAVTQSGTTLAETGTDITGAAWAGAAIIALGGALVSMTIRRRVEV